MPEKDTSTAKSTANTAPGTFDLATNSGTDESANVAVESDPNSNPAENLDSNHPPSANANHICENDIVVENIEFQGANELNDDTNGETMHNVASSLPTNELTNSSSPTSEPVQCYSSVGTKRTSGKNYMMQTNSTLAKKVNVHSLLPSKGLGNVTFYNNVR